MLTDSLALIELESVGSTNSWLIQYMRSRPVEGPVAVWAKRQTAGRGRLGRQWESSPEASLCLSVALPLSALAPSWVTLVAGVCVLNRLHALGASQVGLKWPNDLKVGERKLGGILCESMSLPGAHCLVVGLGLNLKPVRTPVPSISLQELNLELGGGAADWAKLLVPALVAELPQAIQTGFGPTAAIFRRHDVFAGQQIVVLDQGVEVMQGRAAGVDEGGAYLIETSQGLQAIQSGELSLRTVVA